VRHEPRLVGIRLSELRLGPVTLQHADDRGAFAVRPGRCAVGGARRAMPRACSVFVQVCVRALAQCVMVFFLVSLPLSLLSLPLPPRFPAAFRACRLPRNT
jgi:hypothetical protein